MITNMAGAAVVTAASPLNSVLDGAGKGDTPLKGNIHHSVSRWCYDDIPFDEFAKACKEMGIESIELLGEKDWPVVKQGRTQMCRWICNRTGHSKRIQPYCKS